MTAARSPALRRIWPTSDQPLVRNVSMANSVSQANSSHTPDIHFLSYFTFALGVRKVKAFTAVGPQGAFLRQKATAQRITYASQCSRLAPLTECTDPKCATRVAFYDRTRRPLNTGTRVSALKVSGIEGPSHNHLMSLQIHTPILFGVDEQRGRSDVTLVQAREMLA